MIHPFDALSQDTLRTRPSVKWRHFPEDVLACWVADMDFPPAQEIRRAVADFAQAGDLGYPPRTGLEGLFEAVCGRLAGRYRLTIQPDDLMMMPGIIPGLYLATQTLAGPGEGVVVQPPIYPPFMAAVRESGREAVYNPMVLTDAGWEFDFEGLEQAITPSTRLLMLCNPQNPTGRVFRRDELERLAQIVLRHRLWVVSDELHADLTLAGEFIPLASLGDEIAQRTLTLYGPTKTFNIAGLKIGFAFSHNQQLMDMVREAAKGLVVSGNVLAQAATIAAYRQGDKWLENTLSYLRGNRRLLIDFVERELPEVALHAPEGTYLAWLDFRKAGLQEAAAPFLLANAKVGLNGGPDFGPPVHYAAEQRAEPGLESYARLNFATSKTILNQALEQIRDALAVRR
ncbi:MAG: PatB family C-S lyase [Trueperaceae bacterium]